MKCKKLVSLLLVAVLVLGMAPVRVFAAEQACGDDAYWRFEDGTLTIRGPGATYDYYGFDVYSPWNGLEITRLVIEEGITAIGTASFAEQTALTEVSLPDSLEVIGSFAFMGCTALETVELPFGLRSLGQQAFWRTGLKAIEIPATVTFVDACVFESCEALTDVLFRSNVYIPSMVMGNSVFRYCSSLEEIRVEEGHLALRSIDGALFFRLGNGELNLNSYPSGRKDAQWQVPEGTRSIGQLSVNNPYLETVIFPAGLESIGIAAFQVCSGLKELVFQGSAPSVGSMAFMSSQGEVTVRYPCGDDGRDPCTGESWEMVQDSWSSLFGMAGTARWEPSHRFGDWTVVKEATETEEGQKQRTCASCSQTETETISSLSIVGDVDGNGTVNLLDLLRLRQSLAGWDVTIQPVGADCDGDGKINILDLIRLRQYLANWDVTLGK